MLDQGRLTHVIAVIVTIALCGMVLSGCGSSISTAAQSGKPQALSDTGSSGNSSAQAGAGSVQVSVTNRTGTDITGIAIKATSDADYASDHTFSGFTFANGSTMMLSFDPIPVSQAMAGDDAKQSYDVRLSTSADGIIVIRGIDLPGLTNLAFCFTEGVGYASYTDSSTQQETNSLESAKTSEANEAATALPPDAEQESNHAQPKEK